MKRYRYIGADPFLVGATALGQLIDEVFYVQVDDFNHPWAHNWHIVIKENWEEINVSC